MIDYILIEVLVVHGMAAPEEGLQELSIGRCSGFARKTCRISIF
jgi:hypothetical protein